MQTHDYKQFVYNGEFEGLLSAVFESYHNKSTPGRFVSEAFYTPSLLDTGVYIKTDPLYARRVLKTLDRIAPGSPSFLYRCFLSEQDNIEMLIYRYIQLILSQGRNVQDDYTDDTVLKLRQIDKQIGREIHRMHAFVRFQETTDDIYFAVVSPDFNVIPLIGDHFRKRYADQQWIIFDEKRKYGLYYNLETVSVITLDTVSSATLKRLSGELVSGREDGYRELWKDYYESVNIPERRNMKLHVQSLPKRYWSYLTEKQSVAQTS